VSALDHAAVRIEAPAPPRRRPNRAALAAVGFALLQLPLTAIALAFEWRSGHQGDGTDPILQDFALNGSAISGPLMPQIILVVLAALTLCRGIVRRIATAGIGVMGVLVIINGIAEGLSDPVSAPQWVLYATGAVFAGLGLGLIAASVHSLRVG
jgi:hypothetical protein